MPSVLLFILFLVMVGVFAVIQKSHGWGFIERGPAGAARGDSPAAVFPKWAWFVLGIFGAMAAAVVVAEEPEAFTAFFFIGVVLAVALFVRAWVREFLFLMSLEDDELPGRLDKAIWAMTMLVLPPLGLWTFRAYRRARWPEVAPKPQPAHDLQ